MDDEILAMFLEDVREHLVDINADLMDIEEAGDRFDSELVNKVFRTAHSIKGSAGFLGLLKIRDLSHRIESVLDMIRGREMSPTPAVVSVILQAFDRLGEMVEDVHHSESFDIEVHVAALTALVMGGLPVEARAAVETFVPLVDESGRERLSLTAHDLAAGAKGGNNLYLVEYDLIHDVHRRGKTPFELFTLLERSGRILDCRTDLAAAGDLDGPLSNRLPFTVLYASILEPDLVQVVFQVDGEYIFLVDEKTGRMTRLKQTEAETAPPPPAAKPRLDPDELAELERRLTEASGGGRGGVDLVAPEVPKNAPGVGFLLDMDAARPVVFKPQGRAGVESAGVYKEEILSLLAKSADVELDLSEVEDCDASFLQILWAGFLEAKALGKSMRFTAVSEPVRSAARLAGFESVDPARHGLPDFRLFD